MVVQSYAECFWGGDLQSTHGYDALINRNKDSKKMCQELEDYLKKRSDLELKFSKSLSELSKCFKYREPIGQLEAALNQFQIELKAMSSAHNEMSVYFSKQADDIRSFRESQTARAKQVEDDLTKAQKAKLNEFARTQQLEKTYKKKCSDRDMAIQSLRGTERDAQANPSKEKDLEKARSRHAKAEEDAQKADDGYKTGVYVLEDATKEWEKKMEHACQIVQELDEKRVHFLRQELWTALNTDSKIALDVDNCCETVRQKLEICDVSQDVDSFMKSAQTGIYRPKHYSFKKYGEVESDPDSSSSTEDDRGRDALKSGTVSNRSNGKSRNVFDKLKGQLR